MVTLSTRSRYASVGRIGSEPRRRRPRARASRRNRLARRPSASAGSAAGHGDEVVDAGLAGSLASCSSRRVPMPRRWSSSETVNATSARRGSRRRASVASATTSSGMRSARSDRSRPIPPDERLDGAESIVSPLGSGGTGSRAKDLEELHEGLRVVGHRRPEPQRRAVAKNHILRAGELECHGPSVPACVRTRLRVVPRTACGELRLRFGRRRRTLESNPMEEATLNTIVLATERVPRSMRGDDRGDPAHVRARRAPGDRGRRTRGRPRVRLLRLRRGLPRLARRRACARTARAG